MNTVDSPVVIDFDAIANETAKPPHADADYWAARHDVKERFALIDALVECREARGLSQKEVAERMGVKQPTVSGFENEGSDPRLSTIQRYARAVDCRVKVWHSIKGLDQVGSWMTSSAPEYTGQTAVVLPFKSKAAPASATA